MLSDDIILTKAGYIYIYKIGKLKPTLWFFLESTTRTVRENSNIRGQMKTAEVKACGITIYPTPLHQYSTAPPTAPHSTIEVCGGSRKLMKILNVDMLQSFEAVYCGDQHRSYHGTTIQITQPNPAIQMHLNRTSHQVKRSLEWSPSISSHKLGKKWPQQATNLKLS